MWRAKVRVEIVFTEPEGDPYCTTPCKPQDHFHFGLSSLHISPGLCKHGPLELRATKQTGPRFRKLKKKVFKPRIYNIKPIYTVATYNEVPTDVWAHSTRGEYQLIIMMRTKICRRKLSLATLFTLESILRYQRARYSPFLTPCETYRIHADWKISKHWTFCFL
jgi:hypothetical protein